LSIFYRGAVDPRLAARKITVYSVLSMLLAIVFVVVERTIALNFVAFFHLSQSTGAMIAFGGVALTAAPIKRHAEKMINGFVSGYLPLDSMIEGERKTMVVALSDLSGYTLLSSTDEKQAVLLAALLQRQAARLTKTHGGRVVKSMGDAVMFAFDDAASAGNVMKALHDGFASAADQLGLTALQVHSGAHLGEVTVARDGDLYGQTVNVAARIQGSAEPGQIVVSDAFASAYEGATYRNIGPRKFKNVPEVVSCRELLA
jgi:class 3 adenylate cyclase